jgi:predicted dehydrogenase
MKVLIIGLGSIARKHIQALRLIDPACVIQALRSGSGREAVLDEVQHIYSLEKADTPDFIIISNPTSLHRETIENILSFRCPLFIEKPIFNSATSEEEQLISRLKDYNTYVACNLRFHPAIKFLKNFLKNDKVDEVNVYCGSYLPEWRPGTDFRNSYSANPELGGGVHLDLIHELDYVCYLFGIPSEVKAMRTNGSSLNIKAVDSARFLFNYTDFTASISLNYFRKETRRTIEIVRENDILSVDLLTATVRDSLTKNVLFQAQDYTVATTYKEQMEYFIKNKNAELMNNAAEAFTILKLATT